ncbi:hypothetical protein KR026_002418 [Drosophila bipectinata]|nr:hypothetical protein KR026_002418 [Drosophila bipectinata]
MPISPILCIAGLVVIIYFLWTRRRYYKLMLKLPGPLGLPFLGSAPDFIINKFKMNQRTKYMDKYGSTLLTWIGIQPVILSRDPKIAEDVLTSPQCLHRTSRVTKAIGSVLGPGLLSLKGTSWIKRRKLLNASFKQNVLLSFLSIFNAESRLLVSQIDSIVGQGETDLLPKLVRWSFSIAHQNCPYQLKMKGNNSKHHCSLVNMIVIKVLIPFCQNNTVSNIFGLEEKTKKINFHLSKFSNQIIDNKLLSKPESYSVSSSKSVICQLMELYGKGKISFEEIRGECCNIIQAAIDTTSVTVNHNLILLAMFPKYQELVFEELKGVFPAGGDFEVEHEDLQKLLYLDQVFNETLRLFPPIPFSIRDATEAFFLSNGVLVPKGVILGIDIFNMHRNRDLWGHDADSFNPDRFLAVNDRLRHPYAFIPFSKGRRNCIGWKYAQISIKVALARVLRNFIITTTFQYKDLVSVDNIVMKLNKPPLLNFKRRTS